MTKIDSVQKVAKPFLHVVGETRDDVPNVEDEEIRVAVGRLSEKGKALATATSTDGQDRSDRLFELGALLREAGVKEDVTFATLQRSPWNKFAGREDESLRLWEAVERTRQNSDIRVGRTRQNYKSQSVGTLLSRNVRPAEWAVEGIWGRRQYGFVAGEPKTFKSTITTDLAISIATQTDFLEYFPVLHPGPVLIIQEENTEDIQHARFSKILRERELTGKIHSYKSGVLELTPPTDCPVYSFDRTGFSFSNVRKCHSIEREISILRPTLVIFDPLQMMSGGLKLRDEGDVAKIFRWLNYLNKTYKCGILIVHHYHKRREEGPQLGGQRMLGSQALHAWLMCGLYMQRTTEGLRVNREFRAFAEHSPFDLKFEFEDDENIYRMNVQETPKEKTPTGKRSIELQEIVAEQPGITVAQVSKMLDWDEKRVRQRVKALNLRIVRGKTSKDGHRESSSIYPEK